MYIKFTKQKFNRINEKKDVYRGNFPISIKKQTFLASPTKKINPTRNFPEGTKIEGLNMLLKYEYIFLYSFNTHIFYYILTHLEKRIPQAIFSQFRLGSLGKRFTRMGFDEMMSACIMSATTSNTAISSVEERWSDFNNFSALATCSFASAI